MDGLFLTFLNMSLTGAFVILAICLARLPLKKVPKIISYCLWAVAGFRLVLPISIESILGLIPFRSAPITSDIAMQPIPHIDIGFPVVNTAINNILPIAEPTASVNPLQLLATIGGYVWIAGAAVMLIYGVISYFLLKNKMKSAILVEKNIFESNTIQSPFVLGFLKPKIYMPHISNQQERNYIVLHEQTHINRYDHIIKFTAYFILCLHWFNPLVWVAFFLMSVDMEMSCDERVLKEVGEDTKKGYSYSLLTLAAKKRAFAGSPLAFSEGGLKARIKNVLNFRKTPRVIVAVAVALTIALGVGLSMNRASSAYAQTAPYDFRLAYELSEYVYDEYLRESTAYPIYPYDEIVYEAASEEVVPDEMFLNDYGVALYIDIPEIASGEAIAVARVFVSDGIIYNVRVETDYGDTIFSGLRAAPYETEMSGQWFSFFGAPQMPYYNSMPASSDPPGDLPEGIQFQRFALPEGFYYIYVGNQGFDALINARVHIFSHGTNELISIEPI